VVYIALLSLIMPGGELPDGAKLSVRFDPPRVKAGEKTALEISVTPPTGAVLLAFAQPKSLGTPTAVNVEPSSLVVTGRLEEPAVQERGVAAIQADRVRYYPHSFGGTAVVRLPMAAPSSFDEGRIDLRGVMTLLFVEEKTGKVTLASAIPFAATLEEETPTPVLTPATAVESTPPVIIDAPAKQKPDAARETSATTGTANEHATPTVEIVTPETTSWPPPKQRWFFVGMIVGLFALAAGPIGLYDERRWWARWLSWRRFQSWTAAAACGALTAAVLLLPARTAVPALIGSAAFGAMLFVTGGGPGMQSASFVAAAMRAQPLFALTLCVAALMNAACWDAAAGFAAMFLARSCGPAMVRGDEEFEEEEEEEEERPRRRRKVKRGFWRAA